MDPQDLDLIEALLKAYVHTMDAHFASPENDDLKNAYYEAMFKFEHMCSDDPQVIQELIDIARKAVQ